jgi:hypothetical protein
MVTTKHHIPIFNDISEKGISIEIFSNNWDRKTFAYLFLLLTTDEVEKD